jgi:hypothetical protein
MYGYYCIILLKLFLLSGVLIIFYGRFTLNFKFTCTFVFTILFLLHVASKIEGHGQVESRIVYNINKMGEI